MENNRSNGENSREQQVRELTSYLMHKHYCENDVESLIRLFDDPMSWFGAGEEEYAVGYEKIAGLFRTFAGVVPRCSIADEEYHVLEIAPDIYLCTGRAWITTDPSTNMYLQVHQRITTVFRWKPEGFRCCHIHISNPYSAMADTELGFPTQMGKQSYEYLQECINEQKMQINAQTEMLERMSYEDSLTGLYNRNKFNQIIDQADDGQRTSLGVACFDMNGLKEINDTQGHIAGDDAILRTGKHISNAFPGRGFRIGGDEFVVIDEESDEAAFRDGVEAVCRNVESDGLSVSAGFCWRSSDCRVQEQFEEADKRMYQNKSNYYRAREHDRRRR